RSGEKRGGMPVRSDAEEDQIERGRPPAGGIEKRAKLPLIGLSRRGEVAPLRRHPVNIFRRNRNLGDQRLAGRPIVRVGVVRRDGAFIAPKKMDLLPGDLIRKRGGRQISIKGPGGGAPRQGRRKTAPRRDRLDRRSDKAAGRLPAEIVKVAADPDPVTGFSSAARRVR